ncbi:uncharacterized protein LOC125858310 [Solanum stenotomum]|uniref:uncharacterized protein LOC125858310 n=1 Tax=Solanum stenotomum TaxID=172797 RepID=UPI0020D10908|nr:uncharacterized protein LOC125858310 [Solanum stenotomum]
MQTMAEPIDYSRTQRIVLLIDLNPLLILTNPAHYLNSILATSTRLLNFPSLCNSLFAFNFFFSSLSPLRSSSAIHGLFPNLSPGFNHQSQTLESITEILSSFSLPVELEVNCSKACHTACYLLQLVHDYVWESEIESTSGKMTGEIPKASQNLIVLFSPISRSLIDLAEYVHADVNSEILKDFEGFKFKFSEIFGPVRNAFDNRNIHFSWIDVRDEKKDGGKVEFVDEGEWSSMLENGIKHFGWGNSSTDSIVLGSALIPFGLIYPEIGMPFDFLKSNSFDRGSAQLNLEILDVNGKPLECKLCDLELLNLTTLPKLRSEDILNTLGLGDKRNEGCDREETFWSCLGESSFNMHLKAVQKCNVGEKIEGCSSSYILVQQSARCKTNYRNDTCVDGVLDVLSGVKGQHSQGNSTVLWKILLSFLYEESYCVSVTVSNSNGSTITGVLRPLTAQLALLSRIEGGHNYGSILKQMNDMTCGSSNEINVSLGNGKRKKDKKCSTKNLTWSSFLKAAFECNNFELVDICFARKVEKSKKLKFLKCWMKQIKKSSICLLTAADSHKRQPQQPSSTQFPSESTLMLEGDAHLVCSETAEAFFNNLPRKIQHGLQSGRDLHTLAARLVKSLIQALSQKYEIDDNIGGESQIPKTNDSCCKTILPELMKILLRKPKEMKEKLKHDDPSEVFDFSSTSEHTVREFEMQILLRMEILGSTLSESIKESSKQKLVKEICSFLEIIQYLVEGGIHGDLSLYDYVERTIRLRYHSIIEDIVNRIYTEMDLLPFGVEDEKQALLFNSEDSNQSWREKQERYEMAEANNMRLSVSAEDEFCQPPENIDGSSQAITGEEHARKLSEARDRREKARRFGSFTRMPDLQRVWAPKQLKAVKIKCEDQKELKRKERKKVRHNVVYETPMSGKKWSSSQSDGNDDEKLERSSTSVSKALFQDW